jgi:MarR family 2-MHQ and catechol resistance regulon transcriptional repressor
LCSPFSALLEDYLEIKYIDVKMVLEDSNATGGPAGVAFGREPVSGVHLWLVLWKAYGSLREHAYRHIASVGLGLSDFAILEMLLHKGPLPVNTIGEKAGLTSGSVSIAVDRLEKRGLVERRRVHLTRAGQRLIGPAFEEHAAAMERAVSGLSAGERVQVVELLKKLGKTAQSLL